MAIDRDPLREAAGMAAGAAQAMRSKPPVSLSPPLPGLMALLLREFREEHRQHAHCRIFRWLSEDGLQPLVVDARCDLCQRVDKELSSLDAQEQP
jgi:hypothetical protein